MKFLIDECRSVGLVTVAEQRGLEARHVAHIGRADWKDWNVARYTSDRDLSYKRQSGDDFEAGSMIDAIRGAAK